MKQGLIVIACIILIVLGIVAWFLFEERQTQELSTPVAAEIPVEAAPEPESPPFVPAQKQAPSAPELEELPLPPLAESDAYAQETLSEVVGEASALRYFVNEGVVARAVATIDALGSRQVPGNIRAMSGPDSDFAASPDPAPPTVILDEAGDPLPQFLSDPSNAGRYLAWVEMLEAVESDRFAELYRNNYPLFQQAWRELGYTDRDFNDRLLEVIDGLLATPVVEEPYRLIKPEAVYLFADEELESLAAGQKILLRMGAENAARVKSKLSEIRQAID